MGAKKEHLCSLRSFFSCFFYRRRDIILSGFAVEEIAPEV